MSAAPDNMASDSAATEPLGDVMSRVARKLQEEHGEVEATLRAITGSATRIVPNAEACGISYVTGPWKIEPRAWTSDLPKDVDSLQERLKQGPCLDAVWEQLVVRVDDVAADQRWPQFAQEAASMGVGSMMCFQLFVQGDQLGAMKVCCAVPGTKWPLANQDSGPASACVAERPSRGDGECGAALRPAIRTEITRAVLVGRL
jgi:hypothetical protein